VAKIKKWPQNDELSLTKLENLGQIFKKEVHFQTFLVLKKGSEWQVFRVFHRV